MRFYVGRDFFTAKKNVCSTTGDSGSGIFPTDESRIGESHDAGLFFCFSRTSLYWISPGALGGDPCDARLYQLVHFSLEEVYECILAWDKL